MADVSFLEVPRPPCFFLFQDTVYLVDVGACRNVDGIAEKAFGLFGETFRAKYPAACSCLDGDQDELLAFYDFPADHWLHLRTTNPIESTFSTVRLRTNKTKGCGSRTACLTMVFKLALSALKRWRALNGANLMAELIAGVTFVDGK